MIHFLPEPGCAPVAPAQIDGLGRALAAVDALGGTGGTNPAPGLANAWAVAGEAQQALLADWSERAVSASAAGLELLASLRDAGVPANPAAIRHLAEAIRGELESMGAVLSL